MNSSAHTHSTLEGLLMWRERTVSANKSQLSVFVTDIESNWPTARDHVEVMDNHSDTAQPQYLSAVVVHAHTNLFTVINMYIVVCNSQCKYLVQIFILLATTTTFNLKCGKSSRKCDLRFSRRSV